MNMDVSTRAYEEFLRAEGEALYANHRTHSAADYSGLCAAAPVIVADYLRQFADRLEAMSRPGAELRSTIAELLRQESDDVEARG